MKKADRILFLVVSYHTVNFFRPIIKNLLHEGCAVRVLAIDELPVGAREDGFDTHQCNWHHFEWGKIHEFDPDRVIVFNGSFRLIHAATHILSTSCDVLTAEVAWFNQNNYIYIDRNIHEKGEISKEATRAMFSRKYAVTHKDLIAVTMAKLRSRYVPGFKPVEYEKDNNVFVPLQLERDTSIVYSSPFFKDMASVVGFVQQSLPDDVNIFVKPHPKEDTDERENIWKIDTKPNVKMVRNSQSSANDFAYHADMVVGINSTVLMEACVHGKPVFNLGKNVLLSVAETAKQENLFKFYKKVRRNEELDYEKEAALTVLEGNQIDFRNPQPWVCDYIRRENFRPRNLIDMEADL